MKWVPLVLVCAAACTGCEEKVRPSVVPLPSSGLPSQESWRSTVIFSDSARVKAILWAGYIAMYGQQEYTLLQDSVHVDFYGEGGLHSSTLTARWGKVNDRTQDFEAYENVVVTSDDSSTLKTDRLFWTNADRRIRTDAFVEIVSANEEIQGHGLVSDQDLKHYTIFRVTGRTTSNE